MFLRKSGNSALVCFLLAIFAFAGFIASQSIAPKDKKHDEVENLEKILDLVKDQIALVKKSHGNLETVLPTYKQYEDKIVRLESDSFTNGTNSPVKIRGGAMTLRFPAGTPVPFMKDAKHNKCYVINNGTGSAATITLIPDLTNPQPVSYTVPVGGQVDLIGSDSIHSQASGNGIQLLVVSTCGPSKLLGVAFITEPNTNSMFYSSRDEAVDDDKTVVKRFLDGDCAEDPGTGDEDTCEHLFKIFIHLKATPSGADPTKNADQSLPCPDGECEVDVGG